MMAKSSNLIWNSSPLLMQREAGKAAARLAVVQRRIVNEAILTPVRSLRAMPCLAK